MNLIDTRSVQDEKSGVSGPVVILVDNKNRDLGQAMLIAHHFRGMGIACIMEPLEAFRAVVPAYRPSLVLFNHLNASHLAAWTRRMHEIGVLVGVLPNEGIIYQEESRSYMSGGFHKEAHIDLFFCWNDIHAEAVREAGFGHTANIMTVGVPRFDFYFKPWSRVLPPAPPRTSARPRVLFCTNFVFARMWENMQDADALFGGRQQQIAFVRDYRRAVQSHWNSQQKIFDYITPLLADGRFEVMLRPHPHESAAFYQTAAARLPDSLRANLKLGDGAHISSLILDCDLQISCETCTTAIESWIAKKPTIELIFDKHPMLYHSIPAASNVQCEDPAALPAMVAHHLAAPDQQEKQEKRRKHLELWCAGPDGTASLRVAQAIRDAVLAKSAADWSKLSSSDTRRAMKLKLLAGLGLPYGADLLMPIKHRILPVKYSAKMRALNKTITAADVKAMSDSFECLTSLKNEELD